MRFNPFRRIRRHDEEGSIAIFITVAMITTALVIITAQTVENGLRSSRRSGDSANALQVADAGVNDALTAIQTAGSTSFTRTGTVGDASYTYTATQDATDTSQWLVDVYGTDKTGVKRHARAVVTGQPLFASPMYINTSLTASAGAVLDSFKSGESLVGPSGNYTDGGCTDKGIMFFNPNASVTFQSSSGGGGGTSVNNCNKARFGNSWDFSMDGCRVYGGVMTLPSTAFGTSKCPDPNHSLYPDRSKAVDETFVPPQVKGPTLAKDVNMPDQNCPAGDCAAKMDTGTFTCKSSNKFKAGYTYYYAIIRLEKDCGIDLTTIPATADPEWVAANTVELYATSVVIVTGTQGSVNAPPVSSRPSICGTSGVTGWNYEDTNNNPASYYCTGWVRSLSINVLDGSNASVSISGNNGRFWGTFTAPQANVTLEAPGMEFWGAMLAGNLKVKNQFSWHYDESLSQHGTGKYSILNWREEPV